MLQDIISGVLRGWGVRREAAAEYLEDFLALYSSHWCTTSLSSPEPRCIIGRKLEHLIMIYIG